MLILFLLAYQIALSVIVFLYVTFARTLAQYQICVMQFYLAGELTFRMAAIHEPFSALPQKFDSPQ